MSMSVLKKALLVQALMVVTINGAGAEDASKHQPMNAKEETKSNNVAEARKLNGDAVDPTVGKEKRTTDTQTTTGEKTKDGKAENLAGASNLSETKNKQDAKKTADAVNKVPGVKVNSKDLEPPTAPPIHGFHPIKKLLRPVENLEGMSIKLEQQIMKLEGPIAGLHQPMLNLQKKMDTVDHQITGMQKQLNGMEGQVNGVRGDIAAMRKDIQALRAPIVNLEKPIGSVSKPLEGLQSQLNFIILTILIASGAICIGTPIAAILIYKNRHHLFPDLKEHDLPKVDTGSPSVSNRR